MSTESKIQKSPSIPATAANPSRTRQRVVRSKSIPGTTGTSTTVTNTNDTIISDGVAAIKLDTPSVGDGAAESKSHSGHATRPPAITPVEDTLQTIGQHGAHAQQSGSSSLSRHSPAHTGATGTQQVTQPQVEDDDDLFIPHSVNTATTKTAETPLPMCGSTVKWLTQHLKLSAVNLCPYCKHRVDEHMLYDPSLASSAAPLGRRHIEEHKHKVKATEPSSPIGTDTSEDIRSYSRRHTSRHDDIDDEVRYREERAERKAARSRKPPRDAASPVAEFSDDGDLETKGFEITRHTTTASRSVSTTSPKVTPSATATVTLRDPSPKDVLATLVGLSKWDPSLSATTPARRFLRNMYMRLLVYDSKLEDCTWPAKYIPYYLSSEHCAEWVQENLIPRGLPWKEACEVFIKKYHSATEEKLLEKSWRELKQGSMPLTEFNDKFLQMATLRGYDQHHPTMDTDKRYVEDYISKINEGLSDSWTRHPTVGPFAYGYVGYTQQSYEGRGYFARYLSIHLEVKVD